MKILWYEISISKNKGEKSLWTSPFGRRWDDLIVNKNTMYDIYRNNSDIKSCVRKIANYVGKEWFVLKDKKNEPLDEGKNKDDYDLVYNILDNPTFDQTKIEFFKHLTTSGELYLLPTTVMGKKEINWFQIIHPKSITKIVRGWKLVEFRQTTAGNFKKYSAEETKEKTNRLQMYKLEKHTDNELNGMGIIEGLMYDALWDFSASKRNYYFFENDNTPPSILVVEQWLSDTNIELLAEQIKERHKWPENAHKMFMGVGVKDIKSTALSPKDMEHIQQRKLTIDKITSAYGVPRAMLGYTEWVNYNNATQMYKELVEGTINPYQSLFEYILNDFLKKYIDFKYYVEFNKIDPTDQFDIAELRMKKVAMWWLTIDERRGLEGKEPYNTDESKKPLISKGVSLLEDIWIDTAFDTNNT